MIRFSVVRNLIGLMLGSAGMFACATVPVLKPAPGDSLVPGQQNVVQADVAGVRVTAAGDAWKGDPSDLGKLFTPVLVTIENHSPNTVRVSYADFSLSGSSGFKYAAIPPMKAKGQIGLSSSRMPVRLALYEPQRGNSELSSRVRLVGWEHGGYHRGFMIAPHYAGYYPGWSAWPYSYPYDPFFYDSLYAYWPEQLPTQDMLSKGLPEGAVQPNGTISGFVYFKAVGDRESSVTFAMNLVDATNGQQLGEVSIPFAVSK